MPATLLENAAANRTRLTSPELKLPALLISQRKLEPSTGIAAATAARTVLTSPVPTDPFPFTFPLSVRRVMLHVVAASTPLLTPLSVTVMVNWSVTFVSGTLMVLPEMVSPPLASTPPGPELKLVEETDCVPAVTVWSKVKTIVRPVDTLRHSMPLPVPDVPDEAVIGNWTSKVPAAP